ncbi:MAG: Shikimate/quinate 5-dehydrogenase [Parcubacteria group bacterium GW2011_GWB1_43_8]|nr:MAG: Shikimate/quinate 5-dehydrogenase [Parcubacteria group bacterium GW2011_GWB1_43_8]
MKLFSLIYGLMADLVVRYLPSPKVKDKFVFIVHPRSTYDAVNKFFFLKFLPKPVANLFLRHLWPITATKIEGLKSLKTGKNISGWILGVPLTPRQMIENRMLAKKRILQAVKLAEKKGARTVGLGGLTGSLTEGGTYIVNNNNKVDITTGRSYTAHTVTENFFKLAEYFDISLKNGNFAIVGGGGSIGLACAEILVRKGVNNLLLVDLVGRKENMGKIINQLKQDDRDNILNITFSHQIHDIINSDIIIAATNAPEAVIKSEDLKPGAIVIDDAQPSDVDKAVLKERDDVLVVEGGVVRANNIKYRMNMGLAGRNDIFSCLAEVLAIAAHEKTGHYTVGWLDLKLIDEISDLGAKLGFKLAPFQNKNGYISKEKIEKIREIIKNKLI